MITLRHRALFAAAAIFLAALPIGPAGQLLAQDRGQFVDLGPVATTQIAPPKVVVWLPPGYDFGKGRYAVVYMHDGQNVFDPKRSHFNKVWAADKSAERLIASGKIAPCVKANLV
jgi:hypothetical protein